MAESGEDDEVFVDAIALGSWQLADSIWCALCGICKMYLFSNPRRMYDYSLDKF